MLFSKHMLKSLLRSIDANFNDQLNGFAYTLPSNTAQLFNHKGLR